MTFDLRFLIAEYSAMYSIDPDLAGALVYEESRGCYWAARCEEKWFAARLLLLPASKLAGYVPRSGTPSLYDEKLWRAHSWGLTQVMGDRARILGFSGDFLPELISSPEPSLNYGLRYLHQCMNAVRELPEKNQVGAALLKYNGGGDQNYPTRVLGHLRTGLYLRMFENR